ncbi:SPOR domain-containing protein [Uliginosibacterium sp. 31-16]|uniref:SPOR domain-containing protein n=1 Tax=Uliginosibacterium sp. 31-16 TaxID=3068315 RepID=UPI00273FD26B|nr:SPOR domain-containing protein [Uliginosibacterium sp. 31-16]MDP5239791.1 SPOR domain-containing protein [Uliginosibacterium sp. 31-16]
MADNDVQLDLKKRARRRLVGAIALALLAAIILPMIMDSEPRPGSNELQIRIPSQEGSNYASRLITGTAPPPASPVLPVQSAPVMRAPAQSAPLPVASAPAGVQSAPRLAEKPVATAQSAAPAVPEVAASKPVIAPKSVSEAQRAREILEGKPAAAREPAGQKFYVQLGVFRDEANAREVLNRAGAGGVKAGTQKVEDKTRVRAGPFSDRAAADVVVAKLKKAGLNGIVTSK